MTISTVSASTPVPSPAFVHLRSHSEFSVVDGITRIPTMVAKAKEYGQPALAITDLANLFGLIKFYKAARKQGIKAIAGSDLYLENEIDRDKPFKVAVLAMNFDGYLALCELLTKAWLTNQYKGRGEVKREWLFNQSGLILLSGAHQGDVGQALLSGNVEQAWSWAQQWQEHYPNRYYVELQRAGFADEERYIQAAISLAGDLSLPVVATHPIQFAEPEDFRAHEVRVCIAEGEQLANPRRARKFTPEQYFVNSEYMQQRFADIPSALLNTIEIAKRCNLELKLGVPHLPDFPTPEGMSLGDYLIKEAEDGLEVRLTQLYSTEAERDEHRPTYSKRLRWECQTIIDMGFPGYFLIVADFINWGKANGVPVGPGRGSGAGSLVAYSMGITDLDPLRYDLLFERFLNPERVSMPDFDIDFCQDNRERVIDYVKERYGRDAVSQIATFGTLGAKAVIRDVGRVLELPYGLCDSLSKLIPFSPADPWSLKRALAEEPAFKERYDNDEEVQSLIDLARPLEGLTRSVGMHAGGVLIAPGKLIDFCPLYRQPGEDANVISQYDKDDVEDAGLVKFDFLGLRNLTILDWAVKYVRQFNEDKKDFDLITLGLDDKAAYKVLCDGNTTAVFQLESRGMKELLRNLRPSNFEDIIAMLALYRPGPLESGMVVDFVNRKHGRAEVDYFHPDLTSVLDSTYGVIVYQEQVMLISQIIGGYSLGGADLLRRAMGKKKPEEMAMHREIFEKGAVEKGYDADLAVKLFDLMEMFAGYGFNKSHSAAYALIAYHTAWLKAHHPAEFIAATMLSDMDDTEKMQIFWKDAVANNVAVLPPDVNASEYRFIPVNDTHSAKGKPPRTIRYGLGAVKGAGEAAIHAIVAARQAGGAFKSLFDFCKRVDRASLNKRTLEALIKAGAFDSIDMNRAALLATVSRAMEAADQVARNAHQVSLFDDSSDELIELELEQVPEWDLQTRLRQEKSAMGFFFSGHLFDAWRDEVRRFAPRPLASLEPSRDFQWFAGVLSGVRVRMTRRGRMMIATLDDGSSQVEVTIFNELFELNRQRLKEDQLIIVKGKVSFDDYSGGLRVTADEIYDLQLAREARARSLRLRLKQEQYDTAKLYQLLNPFRAEPENHIPGVAVELALDNMHYECQVRLGQEWRVRLAETMLEQIEEWLGTDAVEINY